MTYLVTGAAGFIGSSLCDSLLADGHHVRGLDAFIPYYPAQYKHRNIASALKHPNFQFTEVDLRRDPMDKHFEGVDVVYHLAAMPGLVASWTDFDLYMTCNVQATQRLLEAARKHKQLKRFVYASTSSVYGKFASGDEGLPTKPVSPYGVTKLAGENLGRAYLDSFDLPLVVLRFFSVYGPRQRPDMAYHKFMKALIQDEGITIFGDGQQVRGNTFIGDCVNATKLAANAPVGEVYNIGGGEMASVYDILKKIEAIAGRKFKIRVEAARAGDQRHTFADTTKLRKQLNWEPQTTLDEGLALQYEWQQKLLEIV